MNLGQLVKFKSLNEIEKVLLKYEYKPVKKDGVILYFYEGKKTDMRFMFSFLIRVYRGEYDLSRSYKIVSMEVETEHAPLGNWFCLEEFGGLRFPECCLSEVLKANLDKILV